MQSPVSFRRGFRRRSPPTRAWSRHALTAWSRSRARRAKAVLCLEIDEGTEHAPQIRAKLAAYNRVLPDRAGWHLLFLVPTADRLAWLRRVGRSEADRLAGRLWAIVLGDVDALGLRAPLAPISGSNTSNPLGSLLRDPRPRRCATPVGSDAWVTLLGSGGGEDLDETLR